MEPNVFHRSQLCKQLFRHFNAIFSFLINKKMLLVPEWAVGRRNDVIIDVYSRTYTSMMTSFLTLSTWFKRLDTMHITYFIAGLQNKQRIILYRLLFTKKDALLLEWFLTGKLVLNVKHPSTFTSLTNGRFYAVQRNKLKCFSLQCTKGQDRSLCSLLGRALSKHYKLSLTHVRRETTDRTGKMTCSVKPPDWSQTC